MRDVELVTERLIDHLIDGIEKSSTICILVSFLMKSGVELLKESLQRAAERGADIKICTGDYLFVTQPEALQALCNLHENIEVRLYKSNGTAFHPKSYMFEFENNGYFIVGSSNLSRSALTTGVEWNLAVSGEKEVYEKALNEFTKLMYH